MTGRGRDIGCRRALLQELLPKGTRGSILRRTGGMEARALSCLYEKKPVYPRGAGCATKSGKAAWASYD